MKSILLCLASVAIAYAAVQSDLITSLPNLVLIGRRSSYFYFRLLHLELSTVDTLICQVLKSTCTIGSSRPTTDLHQLLLLFSG